MRTPNSNHDPRLQFKRGARRGTHDPAIIRDILDAAFLCHVAFVEDGAPVVLPTSYARVGDELILHGSPKSRALVKLGQGEDVCISVTVLDGLILSRSAAHHSVNYRSVVLFGGGRRVVEAEEKEQLLEQLLDFIVPGRSQEARSPSPEELAGTEVVAVPIATAGAKVRAGFATENERDPVGDLALPIWAGVLPMHTRVLQPIPDPACREELPPSVAGFQAHDVRHPARLPCA